MYLHIKTIVKTNRRSHINYINIRTENAAPTGLSEQNRLETILLSLN